jgi:Protein of unknown function (DUF3177)
MNENDVWFRWLVWLDYRLALLFVLIIPIILLIWAFVQKAQPIQHLLVIYWRVASLLAITIYLMIAQYPVSFFSGLMARILIPISLWFWIDLNEEIDYLQNNALKLTFTSWRWATSFYCVLGALGLIPSLGCANTKAPFLGVLGILGLIIYVIYLSYFVLVKLGKQGRSAVEQ